ncbi:hypothetical protein [Oceanibaculum indicum]|uniref:hypothetical protein n=1 Tax=Oceanibaculum indicum TaxID=526216 RepID=UPI000EB20799|nr:hypothetical protein [Oceanibaculum indicum]
MHEAVLHKHMDPLAKHLFSLEGGLRGWLLPWSAISEQDREAWRRKAYSRVSPELTSALAYSADCISGPIFGVASINGALSSGWEMVTRTFPIASVSDPADCLGAAAKRLAGAR